MASGGGLLILSCQPALDDTKGTALDQPVLNGYDIRGRLLSTTDASGITTGLTYDPAGNRISVKDGRNQVTTFQNDGLNRLTKQTFANGTPDGTFTTRSRSWGRPARAALPPPICKRKSRIAKEYFLNDVLPTMAKTGSVNMLLSGKGAPEVLRPWRRK